MCNPLPFGRWHPDPEEPEEPNNGQTRRETRRQIHGRPPRRAGSFQLTDGRGVRFPRRHRGIYSSKENPITERCWKEETAPKLAYNLY